MSCIIYYEQNKKSTIFAAITLGTFRTLQNLNLFRIKRINNKNQLIVVDGT